MFSNIKAAEAIYGTNTIDRSTLFTYCKQTLRKGWVGWIKRLSSLYQTDYVRSLIARVLGTYVGTYTSSREEEGGECKQRKGGGGGGGGGQLKPVIESGREKRGGK